MVEKNYLEKQLKLELKKWLITYEELLNKIPTTNEFYRYEFTSTDNIKYYVSIMLLEITDECLHPCLTIHCGKSKKKLFSSTLIHETYDWIVYKDGRIDV